MYLVDSYKYKMCMEIWNAGPINIIDFYNIYMLFQYEFIISRCCDYINEHSVTTKGPFVRKKL